MLNEMISKSNVIVLDKPRVRDCVTILHTLVNRMSVTVLQCYTL